MNNEGKKRLIARVFIIQFFLILSVCLLGLRSFDVQILQARKLTRKAENTYFRTLVIQGERGEILDRHGSKLGINIDLLTVTADPTKVKDLKTTVDNLATVLSIDKKTLAERLSTQRRFTVVARDISPDQAKQIKDMKLKGIYFKKNSKRFYPNRSLAAQLIGFTGNENTGLEGLEFKYNSILMGKTTKIKTAKDGNGWFLDIEKDLENRLKGNSIVLTIDKKIQFFSEQILAATVEKFKATSGMVLIMKPNTGELLAIANYPGFNPNNYRNYNKEVYRNRTITDSFEPGSVMKVFTASAALENGGLTPESLFYCEKGKYKIGRYVINDTHPREWLSINNIIKFSSNIGSAKIIEAIGKEGLYKTLHDFGFGTKTNLGCPGETPGILANFEKWSNIDASTISFGQGLSVSGIQLITGIAAIANKGKLMQPMVIKKILSNSGEAIKVFSPLAIRQAISEQTAQKIKKMMRLVIEEDGTGTNAEIHGYKVCGKTGTAQKASTEERGYAIGKYISVFVGFAPMANPQLATLVVVDEPKVIYWGGDVAAPAFRKIMAQSLAYLNIPPDKLISNNMKILTGKRDYL